jgi:(S)-ureidoglycine aminohydrolase
LFPLEGYPASKLPAWPEVTVRVLTSPAMGAQFAEYLLEIPTGKGGKISADQRAETFFYILSGHAELSVLGKKAESLAAGGFALIPCAADYQLIAKEPTTVLMLKKVFEPLVGIAPPPLVVGNEASVPKEVYLGDEGALLQTLIPDELSFDLAMNIFTFAPGHSLPVVETHVMEHGLYVLQGKGVYYLDREWMEVNTGDFIWMGPYVPQSYYATGPVASRYIYYKNVNRDVVL